MLPQWVVEKEGPERFRPERVSTLDQLPVGHIAQLVEHCTAEHRRGQDSSPAQAWIFKTFLSLLLKLHNITTKIINIEVLRSYISKNSEKGSVFISD